MAGWGIRPTCGCITLRVCAQRTSRRRSATMLSGCESFLSMTQVVSRCPTSWVTWSPCSCFVSSPVGMLTLVLLHQAPAAPQSPVDASPDAFPELVQTMVWRCRGLCMGCKKACCGKSDEDYDKVKWHKNHRCNYCWTVWKAEHR